MKTKYSEEELEHITQKRCVRSIMQCLEIMERGKLLNDDRIKSIWSCIVAIKHDLEAQENDN